MTIDRITAITRIANQLSNAYYVTFNRPITNKLYGSIKQGLMTLDYRSLNIEFVSLDLHEEVIGSSEGDREIIVDIEPFKL